MKILMVSISSSHFFNWAEQLKDSGHEVYWLDVFDSNNHVEKIDFAHQIIGWRYKIDYPGRYFIKKKFPKINGLINRFNERSLAGMFKKKLDEIKPDVVHSFVMYLGCAPIVDVMKNHIRLKWIYSSWGSDLFYYQNKKKDLELMKEVLPRVDYMFADCRRDYEIACRHGFSGKLLGVFPGRGGYDLEKTEAFIKPLKNRRTIIIKGYQGRHGRCIQVLEALIYLKEELRGYDILIFGANKEVEKYVSCSPLALWENLEVLERIPHYEVMRLMGESLIYIGNSRSDGTPNTLLESIVMGAFPIQSNPGGAAAEIINDGHNGMLIEDPDNPKSIACLLREAINNLQKLREGVRYSNNNIRPGLKREVIRKEVLTRYELVEQNLLKN